MRRLKFTLFALASLLLCSCSAYKKVPYLQGSEYLNMANVQTPLYDAHIMPKDLLTITVNTSDPDAAIPFNLTVATPITANSKKPYQPIIPATISGQTITGTLISRSWAHCTSAVSPKARRKT